MSAQIAFATIVKIPAQFSDNATQFEDEMTAFVRENDRASVWWATIEQSDGYVVGRWSGSDFHCDGSTDLDPAKILDTRVFRDGAELRIGRLPGKSALNGWLTTQSDHVPNDLEHIKDQLEPSVRKYLLWSKDATLADRDGFTEVTRGNGQITVVPDAKPTGENVALKLQVKEFYNATDLGLVSVVHRCAWGYIAEKLEVQR